MMNRQDRANRFSSDMDKMLAETGATDRGLSSDEYDEMLELARTLATTDFSRDSRVRHVLRRRLLNQMGEALITTVELPGPLGLVKNIFSHKQVNPLGSPSGRIGAQFRALTMAGLAALALTLVAIYWLPANLSPFLATVSPFEQSDGSNDLLSGEFTKQWEFVGEGGISSGPLPVEGRLYAGSNAGILYALDTETGREIWRFQAGGRVEARPTYAAGVVYAAGGTGKLYALAADTGQLLWRFTTGSQIVAAPTVANGVVYVGSGDGHFYAVDAASGEEQWRFQTGGPVWSKPTIWASMIFFGSNDHHLYAIEAATGDEKWRFKSGDWISAAPLVVETPDNGWPIVVVGSHDQFLYAVDAASGQVRWRFQAGDNIVSAATVAAGLLYVGSYDGYLYALTAETGQELWRHQTGHAIGSAAVVRDNVVYVGSGDGYLYAIQAQTGQEIARFDAKSQINGPLAATEELIFFTNGKGSLQAVQTNFSPIDQPPAVIWPADQPTPPPPARFPFAPDAWHAARNDQDSFIHFRGRIVSETGDPVSGFSVEVDNGRQRVLSQPSGPDGAWEIVVPASEAGSGWGWLTLGRDGCIEAGKDFDPQCQAFDRLSESVRVKVSFPDEAIIYADWRCHQDCRTLHPQ